MVVVMYWIEFYVIQGVVYLVEVLFELEIEVVVGWWMGYFGKIGGFFCYGDCVWSLFVKDVVGVVQKFNGFQIFLIVVFVGDLFFCFVVIIVIDY